MPGKQDRFRKSADCSTCGHTKREHAKWDLLFGWFIGVSNCNVCDCPAYTTKPISPA